VKISLQPKTGRVFSLLTHNVSELSRFRREGNAEHFPEEGILLQRVERQRTPDTRWSLLSSETIGQARAARLAYRHSSLDDKSRV